MEIIIVESALVLYASLAGGVILGTIYSVIFGGI